MSKGMESHSKTCLLNRHRDVAQVSRRQCCELLLSDAELSAARVYLLHHQRLTANLTDGLHSCVVWV